ncbi:hypothetical protein BGW80DRAFT_1354406 [Lactifluus volemus]|nr:hypothetical protein BGW80DRAFT_1354406 [Lactifluus volemus]
MMTIAVQQQSLHASVRSISSTCTSPPNASTLLELFESVPAKRNEISEHKARRSASRVDLVLGNSSASVK